MVQAKKGIAPAAPEPRLEHLPLPPQVSIDEEFTAFFNAHYEPLLSFATAWGKDYHDADDALAVVMEYLYENWAKIRKPLAYARRAVTRTILNLRRDRNVDRCFPASHQMPDEADDTTDCTRLEDEQWVAELLTELPPTQYAVLSRFLDGLSMSEIADELRKSESTIRQNLKFARDRLWPRVSEYDRRKTRPTDAQRTREENR